MLAHLDVEIVFMPNCPCGRLARKPPAGHGTSLCRHRLGYDLHRREHDVVGRAPLQDAPPVVEAGGSQAVSGIEGSHAQPTGPPLVDPAPPLPLLPLIPRSAWGHDCALLSGGITPRTSRTRSAGRTRFACG